MKIVGEYSFNGGKEKVERTYPNLLQEIRDIITSVDANKCKDKKSEEKTMPGKMLYSPTSMNCAIKDGFLNKGWTPVKIPCEYSNKYYVSDFKPKRKIKGTPRREMDFIKGKLGVEVQFGKYAFMVYNVCAKMTIFSNLGYIDLGIEIVPIHELHKQMSTGVSYFEQFVWDLEQRGISDIDLPVLILGITV